MLPLLRLDHPDLLRRLCRWGRLTLLHPLHRSDRSVPSNRLCRLDRRNLLFPLLPLLRLVLQFPSLL